MSQTDQRAAGGATTFSQPIRAITTMLLVCALVGAGAWLIYGQIVDILRTNPVLNGVIALVFLFGVLSSFWQVWILAQSVYWIENFVQGTPGTEDDAPPRLLAPLAALLRSRSARMSISASSSRSIQDSVVQRIDEARDITRYLINLLVFLGLLGTFWGLATTVPAVVETIRSLAPQEGESGLDVFGKLMGGLESQLGGMGTAFSSSLLGLAGSLVLGLLELFAGHGQNRFIRELEEWLSSITRLGYAGDGDGADQSALGLLVDHMAQQMEELQALQTQTEANRFHSEMKITELVTAMTKLTDRIDAEKGQAALLRRIAEGQEKLVAALQDGGGGGGSDAESRMRLRSIDVQLLRILEEMAAGRQETLTDLKTDIGQLTNAIRQLGRGPGRA
ncbi:biopolymer transporter ExbB [Tabrizicola sp.]|uniref:biopolymer transporter ExbB n=1 Tax=Tabrizicola sp. TaxID=2005166 RepID=UPI0025DD1014|nr:biopolymer transporter ExbB [Tabrizicola sp.]MBY0349385.1 biopolymer transporter ExbB [Tabrizicola sp.]MDK2774504.1 biopolymer transporter ExbB [Tabrizicola sp.]